MVAGQTWQEGGKLVHSGFQSTRPMKPIYKALFCCLLCGTAASGQDLHFSQFYLQAQALNPAQTGLFTGQWRVAGGYRGQWASVPVQYRTFSAAFDYQVWRSDSWMVSGGLLAAYDRAGDGGLRYTAAGLQGAVARRVGSSQLLSAGFTFSLAQRSVDLDKLTFGNQWLIDQYDPSAPSREPLGRSSGMAPTSGAGLVWQASVEDRRTEVQAGLAFFHLNGPKLGLADDGGRPLPIRSAVHAEAVLQVSEKADVVAFALRQQMGSARELVAGAGVRTWLEQSEGAHTALQLSLGLRGGDAVVPAVQLIRNGWTAGLSFDVNISDFKTATRNNGGIELAVVYRSVPVPPGKVFKSCPIF